MKRRLFKISLILVIIPALVVGFGGAVLAGNVNEVEPNDVPAESQNTDGAPWTTDYNADIGNMVSNTSEILPHIEIYGTGDDTYDWYTFTAIAGETFIFDIDYGYGQGGYVDTYLRLYDIDGNLLAYDDDSPTTWGQGGSTSSLDSYLEYTFTSSGSYFLKVSRFSDSPVLTGTDYWLMISREYILSAEGFITGGGWIAALPYFEGSMYEFVASPNISWYDANEAASAALMKGCESAHLATITSQEEQDFLNNMAFNQNIYLVWLGGYQMDDQSYPDEGWQWVTGEPWDYTNWNTGEPNDSMPGEDNEENHLVGWWAEGWNDAYGNWDWASGYIIEYECTKIAKANFGFNAKYKNNSSVPQGNVEFQSHDGSMNFKSSALEALFVSSDSGLAVLEGTGTVNGDGNYNFKLWVSTSNNTFRIRIWGNCHVCGSETVICDTSYQSIGGGNIQIHD